VCQVPASEQIPPHFWHGLVCSGGTTQTTSACSGGNPEFLHAQLKSRSFETEQGGRSIDAGNDPMALLESRENLLTLDFFQHAPDWLRLFLEP
jgi:hypothetical protein